MNISLKLMYFELFKPERKDNVLPQNISYTEYVWYGKAVSK